MLFDVLRFYHERRRQASLQVGKPEPLSRRPSKHLWRSRTFWQDKVLRKNLLGLSDTQLITGLAVQTAAILKHCEFSIYHFQLVAEMAFLSTATHLLTLVALRDYFVKNRRTSIVRMVFMLANIGLLGYVSYVAYSYSLTGLSASRSLACFYQGQRPRLKAAFFGRWGAFLVGVILGHISIILEMYLMEPWSESKDSGQKKYSWWSQFRHWALALTYAGYGLIYAGIKLHGTQAMGKASVQISGSEKEWGFGQLLPVLLLALPFFAAWESACGKQTPCIFANNLSM